MRVRVTVRHLDLGAEVSRERELVRADGAQLGAGEEHPARVREHDLVDLAARVEVAVDGRIRDLLLRLRVRVRARARVRASARVRVRARAWARVRSSPSSP